MTYNNIERLLIATGSLVTFNRDEKTHLGTIIHILPCLENGRKHAVIELDEEPRGCTHTVPLDQVTLAAKAVVRMPEFQTHYQDRVFPL